MTKPRTARDARSVLPLGSVAVGLSPEAVVMTAEGAIPSAYLDVGERVITRRGMRIVRSIARRPWPADERPVLVLPCALGGKPDRACILPASQRLLVRDWRAQAIWGREIACPKVSDLIDGTFVRWSTTCPDTLLQLFVGQPEILYVDGLELASADPVRAAA